MDLNDVIDHQWEVISSQQEEITRLGVEYIRVTSNLFLTILALIAVIVGLLIFY